MAFHTEDKIGVNLSFMKPDWCLYSVPLSESPIDWNEQSFILKIWTLIYKSIQSNCT